MRQRPRRRAVAVSRQSAAQGLDRTTVLQQQRGRDGGIAGVGFENGAALGRAEKDFGGLLTSIVEEADAGRVGETVVLKLDHDMDAPVRQTAAISY